MYTIEKSIISVIQNHYDYESSKALLIEEIKVRFLYFVDAAKTYLVEDYVENEWRDSYDLYYSKSSYSSCNSKVKRVHFITEEIDSYKGINENNYLGYINIRPIPIVNAVLSRIRLKCTSEAFSLSPDTQYFCMSIYTTINLPHMSIKYKSFPLYSQDSMVAVCAHADILMISKYMYKKFNFNNYKLQELVKNDTFMYNTSGRSVPSGGLTIYQIIQILKANNYNPVAKLFNKGVYDEKVNIIQYIDSFLESALPVILAFGQHVIIIIGHTHNDNNERYYLIADDSTYHLTKSFETRKAHIETVSEKKLKDVFLENDIYIITPSFDRFYLQIPNLNLILEETKKTIIEKYFDKNEKIDILTREVLAESAKIKQFLYGCGDEEYDSVCMPHYVWYIEFYLNEKKLENLAFYMIIDASAHQYDRQYSIIKNKVHKPLMTIKKTMLKEVRQLSLLTKI